MIFRRRREPTRAEPPEVTDPPPETEVETSGRTTGPYDAADITIDPEDETRINLGALVIPIRPEVDVRLHVEEQSGQVVSALLVTADSGLELRAFAAPRREGIWADVRREIAAEATRRGGTASERDGQFGTELTVVLPATGPDGQPATQPSRMVGVDGPRWLLRGTFMGEAAVQPAPDGVLEQAFRDVVVVRGDAPMAPREPLPLSLPAGVQLPDEPPGD